MPESVNRRGSSGPTMGAIVRCSGVVAMDGRLLVPFRLMTIRVRLFAGLRERAGADEVTLELPPAPRDRAAVGAVGRGGGVGAPSRGRVRRGARDHRPDQGRGADLEARGGRVGRGDTAADGLTADRLRALPSVERLAAALDAPHALAVV